MATVRMRSPLGVPIVVDEKAVASMHAAGFRRMSEPPKRAEKSDDKPASSSKSRKASS